MYRKGQYRGMSRGFCVVTHGLSRGSNGKHTKLFDCWQALKKRCYNPNSQRFSTYGGRGIRVCDEWLCNYKNFYDWAMSNGYEEGLCIDRKDNDGNYEPDNCRWVTPTVNNRNKSNGKLTLEKAREIRRLYFNRDYTYQVLAGRFGVCSALISNVINNKIWK